MASSAAPQDGASAAAGGMLPTSRVASPSSGVPTSAQASAAPVAAAEESEIPIRLTLGDATFSIGALGQWELVEHSSLQEYVDRTRMLQERNVVLERENAQLRDRCARMTEESNMGKFKCQLLVEMLALSSLDEEKSKLEAEQEKAKASSIKNDMLVLLDQARKEDLDVHKLATVLTSPSHSHQPRP
ncbi:Chibby family, partial [Globisporangium splendens]